MVRDWWCNATWSDSRPETIWASRTIIFDDHTGSGSWLEYRHYPSAGKAHEYRRADLPLTLAQALKVPEVAAMVEAVHGVEHIHDHMPVKAALAAIEAAMKEEGDE